MARTDTAHDSGQSDASMLGIYLNDHLAGATAGTELAHRTARSHRDGKNGATLRRLAAEIAQDRAALLDIMAALGIKVRHYKVGAAWVGEKAGRLKFNGRLFARSPLSNLEELEMLRLGVEGKAAGWRTLQTLADTDTRLDPGRLDELISRARRQADLLEDLRVGAAMQVTGHDSCGRPLAGHGAAMPEMRQATFQTCLKMAPASTPPSTLTSIHVGLYSTLIIVSPLADHWLARVVHGGD